MATNQTIDGVPRELLERLHAEHVSIAGPGFWVAWKELRALLDVSLTDEGEKPANPKPTGLSQGWNLTRKHDGFVVGHQSMAYPPDEKAIQRAERGGYVWVPFLLPAAQPQGEPVVLPELKDGNGPTLSNHRSYNQGWNAYAEAVRKLGPLYAEQPAPVAVVLPERREPTQDNPYLSDADHDWNACLHEVTRLNAKSR